MDQKPTGPDVWGSAVASGDAVKLSQMVLEWSASKPQVALSFLKKCVAHVEKDLAYCAGRRSPSSTSARPDGVVQNPCLDAFTVVLNQSCEGSDWFTSTKELQLASLPFCNACRNVATMSLRVDDGIPRRLLAAADAPLPDQKRLCTTRVPRLRARRVVWKLPTAMELRRPIYALADVTHMHFDWSFVDTFEGVQWPRGLHAIKIDGELVPLHQLTAKAVWPKSLQYIKFGDNFDQPLCGAVWPESLRRLTLGEGFNRSLLEVVWPTSLEQLAFGEEFNRPLEGVVWPPSLQQLVFRDSFDQPLDRVVWPTNLQQLNLGDSFNQPIDSAVWPAFLQELTFGDYFNQAIEGVVLPASLQELTLGNGFNQPIEQVVWPTDLQQLTFGHCFDQPIEGVSWPTSLQRLALGVDFNQPVEKVKWPVFLQHLTFSEEFDQPIGKVEWPNSLRQLSFGEAFNRPVEEVTWPTSLEKISFGSTHSTFFPVNGIEMSAIFNKPIGEARWPESLRQLTLGGGFSCSCAELGAWMPNLEEFTLLLEDPSSNGLLLGGIEWPKSLRKLTIFDDASLDGATIPQKVQVVRRTQYRF